MSDPKAAQQILQQIPDKNVYQTVVLIAATYHQTGQHKIFTYDDEGALAEQNISFDLATIKKITPSGPIHSLGRVPLKSYWHGPLMTSLKTTFPNAKFILLSINNNAEALQTEIAAYLLKSSLPKPSLVFAIAEFQPAALANLQEFQNGFTRTVLENFDHSKFDELPLKNTITIKTLAHYLRFTTARKAHHLLSAADAGWQILYQHGKPEKTANNAYFVIFGDIMLGRYVRTLIDANTLDYPFEKMNNDYLRVNDILLANLEGPVTKNSVRTTTGMSFGFSPDVVEVLKKYHFDALSQANNHTLDKGQLAWEESMSLLRNSGIIAFGYPKTINPDSIATSDIRGQKYALVGLEEVNFKIDDEQAVQLIKELVQESYRVIVYPHWGIEYTHQPNARQQDLAHKFIDAGAIAVIAHHPHVEQAYETYNGRPILYSLGNAIFDQYWSAATQVGLSIAMSINDQALQLYLVPIKIDRSQMQLMNEEEAKAFLQQMATYGQYPPAEKQMILEGKISLKLP